MYRTQRSNSSVNNILENVAIANALQPEAARRHAPPVLFRFNYDAIYQVWSCWTYPFASCLINAQPVPAHSLAADYNSLIGCTSHDLTDDWSLASTHFVDSQYPFWCSFGCVLLLNQMFWKLCTVRQYYSDLWD